VFSSKLSLTSDYTAASSSPKSAVSHVWPGCVDQANEVSDERSCFVIGFILLIPSALGMVLGLLMLFLTSAAGAQTSATSEREIRARLVAQQIPDPIIREVVSSKAVSDNENGRETSRSLPLLPPDG
jgi:hypothetical protein